jgi:plasmid stabilization system protein ParE
MSFPIGSYVIFYYRDDDPFGISRILHGSRDLPAAFHADGPK